jgi:hypothetical protein
MIGLQYFDVSQLTQTILPASILVYVALLPIGSLLTLVILPVCSPTDEGLVIGLQ